MFLWIGAVVSAVAGHAQAYQQNQSNRRNMRSEQAFGRQMRETQYQTSMEDMRRAGLNPMLAYSQGGGGMPSGGSASGGVGADMNPAISTALEEMRMEKEFDQADAEIELKKKMGRLTDRQSLESTARELNIGAQTHNLRLEGLKKEGFGDSVLGNQFNSIYRMWNAIRGNLFPGRAPSGPSAKQQSERMQKRARAKKPTPPAIKKARNRALQRPSGLDDMGGS